MGTCSPHGGAGPARRCLTGLPPHARSSHSAGRLRPGVTLTWPKAPPVSRRGPAVIASRITDRTSGTQYDERAGGGRPHRAYAGAGKGGWLVDSTPSAGMAASLTGGRCAGVNGLMGAVWLRLRAELRQRWRGWLALAVLLGLIGGVAVTAAAGARRTDTAYPRFLRASHAADLLVTPARSGFHGYFRALARLPEVSSLAPAMFLQMAVPGPGASPFSGLAAQASPYGGEGITVDRVKVVAGRIFNPADPRAVMINQQLADREHLRPGGTLRLIGYPQRGPNPDIADAVRLAFRVSAIVVFDDQIVSAARERPQPWLLLSPAFARTRQAASFNPAGGGASVLLRPGADADAFTRAAMVLAARYRGGKADVVNL